MDGIPREADAEVLKEALEEAPGSESSSCEEEERPECQILFVPMRDGIRLAIDLYFPTGNSSQNSALSSGSASALQPPYPVLLHRTPYRRAELPVGEFKPFLDHGYAVVVQDVRGRFDSEGDFDPYFNEGKDGFDTIEWIASQSWSNGRVGMFGLSYPGAVQWLAAVENPPHLRAIAPAMCFSTPRNFIYAGGLWDLSWLLWTMSYISFDLRVRNNLEGPKTEKESVAWYEAHAEDLANRLPLVNVPEVLEVAPFYKKLIEIPPSDPLWDALEIRGKYCQTKAAVLNLSGWHDEAYGPEGAFTNFAGLLESRRIDSDPKTMLIMGPWVHGGEETPKAGDRAFPADAIVNDAELHLRFFDYYLKDLSNGLTQEPRIKAYLMGENVWWKGNRFETKPLTLYFNPNGKLLPSPSTQPAFTEFTSDPSHPVIDPFAASSGAHDYRGFPSKFPDNIAVFESEAFDKPTRILGPVTIQLSVQTSVPEFDLHVKFYDLCPDGAAWNLSSPGTDCFRTHVGTTSALRDFTVSIPNLHLGVTFMPGHKLRVLVMGSFMPHFSRSLQTGFSERISFDLGMVSAPIRILLGHKDKPSFISLPELTTPSL